MKIVFVLSHIPNPRMNKRLAIAQEISDSCVVCIQRSTQDIYEPVFKSVDHHILKLALPTSKNPFKRVPYLLRFACFALKVLNNEQPDMLYATSIDCLLITRVYQLVHPKVRLVFEVADVREAFLKESDSFGRKLMRYMEKRLYPNVQLLVLTSDKFYHHYYNRYFPIEKVIVMPNIPDMNVFQDYRRKQNGPFTVGFIGGIRYLNQMKMLVDAAEMADVQVLFAGAGGTTEDMEAIASYCQGKTHVRFTGKYQYERDIAKLYGMVDCVYAVYDADNPNVRIALPNKLYEALVCGLPIIVAKGTYLSEEVERLGIGFSVSHTLIDDLIDVLVSLKNDSSSRQEIYVRCQELKKEYNYSVYQNLLESRLIELCQNA